MRRNDMVALGLLTACATNDNSGLDRMLAGQSQMSGSALDRGGVGRGAGIHSARSKIRCERRCRAGERAYLAQAPLQRRPRRRSFERMGSFGAGAYGNILDGYTVDCGAAAPGKVQIFMDMYHGGYVETRPVPGLHDHRLMRSSSLRYAREAQNRSGFTLFTPGQRLELRDQVLARYGCRPRPEPRASPPASRRPRLKVPILTPASPSMVPSRPMKPGASSLTM